MVKNLPANTGDLRDMSSVLRWGRSPEKGTVTHSSILVWRIPWTEESGGLQSMGVSQSQTMRQCSAHKRYFLKSTVLVSHTSGEEKNIKQKLFLF